MIKIFADGADLNEMIRIYNEGIAQGFTTNPTLMKKAGVKDYETFAKSILKEIPNLPISFEVFSDDFDKMEIEAKKIASWGNNIYVKIPITNTKGESSFSLIKRLSNDGIKLNITAILTLHQVRHIFPALSGDNIISIFAGRIADTGRNPIPIMRNAKYEIQLSNTKLLWASCREVYNIVQAEKCGCDIITVTPDILKKLPMLGKDLEELSLETVRMFYNDSKL